MGSNQLITALSAAIFVFVGVDSNHFRLKIIKTSLGIKRLQRETQK